MSEQIYNILWGNPPLNLPPEVKIRYIGKGIAAFFLFFYFFFFLAAILTWRNLPILGPIPMDPFKLHFFYWIKSMLCFVTVGRAFIVPVEYYWNYIGSMPFGMVEGRLLLDVVLASIGGGGIAWMTLIPRNQLIHVKGAQILKGEVAAKNAKLTTKSSGKTFMYLHPALGLPKKAWTRHTLIYGSVGSGKTQILLRVIRQIFKNNHKAIIYDIKGDFTAKFGKALLVSPWDSRSVIWDIARDIDTDSAIREFASSLYPTKPGDKNAFFQQAAASILYALIKSLYHDFNGRWGWKELNQRVSLPTKKLYHYMMEFNESQAKVIEDSESASTSSVLSTFSNGALVINQLAQAWGNGGDEKRPRLSLKKWLRDDYTGTRQIILQGGKDTTLQAAYIAAIINALVPEIISPAFPDNELGRSLFFILDELPTIGKINISTLFALGRSKGCCCIAGWQAISQIKEVYGDDFAKTLPAMVGTQIVCQLGQGETRKSVAGLIGSRRVAVVQNNQGTSGGQTTVTSSYNEQDRDLMEETELTTSLGTSPNWEGVRSIYMSGDKTLMLDFPFISMEDERPSFVEAEWCKSLIKDEPKSSTGSAGGSPRGAFMPPPDPMVGNTRMPASVPGMPLKKMGQPTMHNSPNVHQVDPASFKERDREIPAPEIERTKELRAPVLILHPGDPDYKEAMQQAVTSLDEGEGDPLDQTVEHLGTEALGPVVGVVSHIFDFIEEAEGPTQSKQPRGISLEINNPSE